MRLEEAKMIAEKVKDTLSPYCERIQIAGSIRRQKALVNDIDVVAIVRPDDELLFNTLLCSMGKIEMNGAKIKRVHLPENIELDLYLASPSTWGCLLLIRTGSAENNMKLAGLAKSKGWHLKVGGEGLFDEDGNRIAGDTEESIFEALGIPYLQPHERG